MSRYLLAAPVLAFGALAVLGVAPSVVSDFMVDHAGAFLGSTVTTGVLTYFGFIRRIAKLEGQMLEVLGALKTLVLRDHKGREGDDGETHG